MWFKSATDLPIICRITKKKTRKKQKSLSSNLLWIDSMIFSLCLRWTKQFCLTCTYTESYKRKHILSYKTKDLQFNQPDQLSATCQLAHSRNVERWITGLTIHWFNWCLVERISSRCGIGENLRSGFRFWRLEQAEGSVPTVRPGDAPFQLRGGATPPFISLTHRDF